MPKYAAVPELVALFMEESDTTERWVTVRDLRERFYLSRYQSGTIAGFLHRLEFSSYGQFPYIVKKVELLKRETPSSPLRYRYLLALRTERSCRVVPGGEGYPETGSIVAGTLAGRKAGKA